MKIKDVLVAISIFSITVVSLAKPVLYTDLGAAANLAAAERFATYKSEPAICATPNPAATRVILSGFGPFNGGSRNVSGLTLMQLGGFTTPPAGSDVDAYGQTIEKTINGVTYQICLLVTSVRWDVGAAILISESEAFQPALVLMTGLGAESDAIFEKGNLNQAYSSSGYDLNGGQVADAPQGDFVLPRTDPNVKDRLDLTWNVSAARSAVDADVRALGFGTDSVDPEDEENDYVCNNIAFAVNHASRGFKTELAGGKITLAVKFNAAPKAGFMHYPLSSSTSPESLKAWGEILLKVVHAALN